MLRSKYLFVIVILLIGLVYFTIYQVLSVEKFKRELGVTPIVANQKQKSEVKTETRTERTPPEGASLHGHLHGDERHDEPHGTHKSNFDQQLVDTNLNPVSNAKPIPRNNKLLEAYPVEALRQQSKARGHWSLEYLPPFPPDDLEAAAIARAVYIQVEHFATVPHPSGNTISVSDNAHPHSEEFLQSAKLLNEFDKEGDERINRWNNGLYEGIPINTLELARYNDLFKLTLALQSLPDSYGTDNSNLHRWFSMFK